MMPPSPSSSTSAALPPLPDLSGGPGGGQGQPGGDPMAMIMAGLAPIKQAVGGIQGACKSIVQSGAIPGAEQICGQIVALANSLLPMAAQNLLQPGMGGSGNAPPAPGGGGMGMPPPPGPPPNIGQ